jgi:hypothetical protein
MCVQISSSGDQQFPRGILKSPVTESVVSNKQVQFFGLSSDSENSVVSLPNSEPSLQGPAGFLWHVQVWGKIKRD